MGARFKFDIFADLKVDFGSMSGALTPLVEQTLTNIMDKVVDRASAYPPQPSRSRARTFNTYVRGVGRYPRSAFDEDGNLLSLVAGIDKIAFTSEQLSTKWRKQIQSTTRGTKALVANLASYSDYVVGYQQTDFHAETGWPTILGVIKELDPFIREQFEWLLAAFDDVLWPPKNR